MVCGNHILTPSVALGNKFTVSTYWNSENLWERPSAIDSPESRAETTAGCHPPMWCPNLEKNNYTTGCRGVTLNAAGFWKDFSDFGRG